MRPIQVVLTVVCLVVVPTMALAVQVSGDLDMRVASAYVWRGRVINDDAVFQPSVSLGLNGWHATLWSTWDLAGAEPDGSRRVDLAGFYRAQVECHTLDAGAVGYFYPEGGDEVDDTAEVFLGYALDSPGLPSLTVYYDLAEIKGVYAVLGFAHSVELVKDGMALDLAVSVGAADDDYNEDVFGPAVSAVVDFTASAALTLHVRSDSLASYGVRSLLLVPRVKTMNLVDSELRDAVDDDSEVVASLSAVFAF